MTNKAVKSRYNIYSSDNEIINVNATFECLVTNARIAAKVADSVKGVVLDDEREETSSYYISYNHFSPDLHYKGNDDSFDNLIIVGEV